MTQGRGFVFPLTDGEADWDGKRPGKQEDDLLELYGFGLRARVYYWGLNDYLYYFGGSV